MRLLGRRTARHDKRTLQLSAYLRATPAPPPARDWTSKASPFWGTMLNDQIGDCAIAAPGHAIQAWTANHGREVSVINADILSAYSAVSGYDQSKPDTDVGCVMLDVMKWWRDNGIGGHKIEAFVSFDPRNRLELESAVNLFGGVFLGVALPSAAQDQTVWDVAPPGKHDTKWKPGSWGGHAIYVPAYSRIGWSCITWGALKTATWEWGMTYTDEAYAVLGPEWADSSMAAPNGFDIAALRADLAAITKSVP